MTGITNFAVALACCVVAGALALAPSGVAQAASAPAEENGLRPVDVCPLPNCFICQLSVFPDGTFGVSCEHVEQGRSQCTITFEPNGDVTCSAFGAFCDTIIVHG